MAEAKTGFLDSKKFGTAMDMIGEYAEAHNIPYLLVFKSGDVFISYANIPIDAPEKMAFANTFIQASAEDSEDASELAMAVMAVNSDSEELRKRIENTSINPDMDDILEGMMKPTDKDFAVMLNSILYLAEDHNVPFTGGMYLEKEMIAFMDGITPEDGLEIFFCPFILAGDVIIPDGMFK